MKYIADSGAGRTIYSERALVEQGVPRSVLRQLEGAASEAVTFNTGGGDRDSTKSIGITSNVLGKTEAFKLESAPFAVAMGIAVMERKQPFIWQHVDKPFYCTDYRKLKISCP